MRQIFLTALLLFAAPMAQAFSFTALDGTKLDLTDWRGRPVLIVNTASFCGFTRQYRDMQALHDEYSEDGLVVLAVPSEDFNQEYSDNKDVVQFLPCRHWANLSDYRNHLGARAGCPSILPLAGARAPRSTEFEFQQGAHRAGRCVDRVLGGRRSVRLPLRSPAKFAAPCREASIHRVRDLSRL